MPLVNIPTYDYLRHSPMGAVSMMTIHFLPLQTYLMEEPSRVLVSATVQGA